MRQDEIINPTPLVGKPSSILDEPVSGVGARLSGLTCLTNPYWIATTQHQ